MKLYFSVLAESKEAVPFWQAWHAAVAEVARLPAAQNRFPEHRRNHYFYVAEKAREIAAQLAPERRGASGKALPPNPSPVFKSTKYSERVWQSVVAVLPSGRRARRDVCDRLARQMTEMSGGKPGGVG